LTLRTFENTPNMLLPPTLTLVRRSQIIFAWSLATLGFSLAAGAGSARADVVILVPEQRVWKFLPGTQEASAPDAAAWRQLDFDDAAWSDVLFPIGFGRTHEVATNLDESTPPMRDNYSSLFLRRTFELEDESRVGDLRLRHYVDDGLVAWINGVEVLRYNVEGERDVFIPFDGTANRTVLNPRIDIPASPLPDWDRFLVSGTNVLAVQVFNKSLTNGDVYLDLKLFDAAGPDRTPPRIAHILPVPGLRVRHLTETHVTFTKAVQGLQPGDLLVAGVPAVELEQLDTLTYRFRFPQPSAGGVPLTWAVGHGITDLAVDRNVLNHAGWSYVVEPTAPLPRLRIAEIVAANGSGLRDENVERWGWVEIVNEEQESVSLDSWGLTNNAGQPSKWVFPARVLEAGERLIVFTSEKDRRDPEKNLHTNFKLDVRGGFLALYNAALPPDRIDAFEPGYPRQQIDYAYGTGADGQRAYLNPPTPGLPNTALSLTGLVEPPVASAVGGLFETTVDDTIDVELKAAGNDVRYTLDGSEPTVESFLYSEPLRINETTILRAAAFRETLVPSRPITHTYIFVDQVPNATPREGLPTRWADLDAKYAMDPPTVTEPFFQERLRTALLAIPSVSIVTDSEHLFGSTGLYQNRSDTGRVSERPVSFELLHPDGSADFQVNCGVRIVGNTSRGANPKQSLRVVFRPQYGPSRLTERVFLDSPLQDFNQLILRNNYSDSWAQQPGEFAAGATYVRDAFLRQLQQQTGSLSVHRFFVHLYLNGMYWGIYDLHERPDSSFATSYLGGEREDYDVLKNHEEVVDGNIDAYAELDELKGDAVTDDGTYGLVSQLIDFENLSDYMIVNMFAPALDWPGNYFMLRDRRRELGFFFFSWDADRAFQEGVTANRTLVHSRDADSPTKFYHALREHPEFRQLFADRVERHFSEDGPVSREGAIRTFRQLMERVELPLVAESARWGKYWTPVGYRPDVHWQKSVNSFLSGYLPLRSSIVVGQFRNQGVYSYIRAPRFLTRERVVDPGQEVSLFPRQGQLYYTVDGSDPRLFGGAIADGTLVGAEAEQLTLVTSQQPVRYRVPTNDEDGMAWTEIGFDDSNWLRGTAPIGYGRAYDAEVGTNVKEMLQDANSSIYIRMPFELEIPDGVGRIELAIRSDDGFVAYLNGVRIAALGEPAEVAWDSAAIGPIPFSAGAVPQIFEFPVPEGFLQPGTNVLAVHGLNAIGVAPNATMFVAAELIGFRTSEATRIPLTETTRIRARAREGVEWSPLVEASFIVDKPSPLRVTEILYHAPAPPDGSPYDDSDFDFVELQNTGDKALSLSGMTLEEGLRFSFGEDVFLAAREALVLVRNVEAFASRNNLEGITVAGEYDGRLSNAGETLRLHDALGQVVQEFAYDDAWYPSTDGQGASLVVVDPYAEAERWSKRDHWRASEALGGSPGVVFETAPKTGGLQLPGDATQDARLNISDPIAILRSLVDVASVELSCGDGENGIAGARAVIDVNLDGNVDLTDAVHLLNYLFLQGSPPTAGRSCVPVAGCGAICPP
jgi:hypothetical protein